MCAAKYADFTREQLIEQLLQYERSHEVPSQGKAVSKGEAPAEGSKEAKRTPESSKEDESEQGGGGGGGESSGGGKKRRREREMDFDDYGKKTMAFKLLYFGWAYDGFAYQENTDQTIEGQFIKALLTAKLIKDRSSAAFTRCGRTDKGVSAFGQVISVTLRSTMNAPANSSSNNNNNNSKKQQKGADGSKQKAPREEIPYVQVLNRLLPPDIRVLGACEVSPGFNARFDCLYRVYKYFFIKRDLDIEKIREAAQSLVGKHDFKNFCKIDKSKGSITYIREIAQFDVSLTPFTQSEDPALQVYEFTIRGTAFLWHQVRFMVSILFLVGQGLEKPQIVKDLLDPKLYPQKPTFPMASEIPLVLYDCGFEDLPFEYDHEIQERNLNQFLEFFQENSIKGSLALTALELLRNVFVPRPSDAPASAFEGDKFVLYRQIHPALPPLAPKKYVKVENLTCVGESGTPLSANVNDNADDDDE